MTRCCLAYRVRKAMLSCSIYSAEWPGRGAFSRWVGSASGPGANEQTVGRSDRGQLHKLLKA